MDAAAVVVAVAAGNAFVAAVAALAPEFTSRATLVSGHEGTHWRSGGALAMACCKPLLFGKRLGLTEAWGMILAKVLLLDKGIAPPWSYFSSLLQQR